MRGVNLGGNRRISSAELREVATAAGGKDVRTLLQSGNLVFRGLAKGDADAERLLERELEKRLGFHTDVFVRSGEEWDSLIRDNPLEDEARTDPAHLVAMVLKEPPARERSRSVERDLCGPEYARICGRVAYVFYPKGIADSRLTAPALDRALGTRCTGRNWNTVLKLAALSRDLEGA